MSLKAIIYPYKLGSRSGKALARALATRCVRANGRYVPRRNHLVVSLGSSITPNWEAKARQRGVEVVNIWSNMAPAQNKLTALIKLQRAGVPVPKFTASKEEAKSFFTQNRSIVFCRTLLRAHGGRGIVIARSPNELVHAPLYTKYFKKHEEYRVHVFRGQVIDFAKKKLRNGVGEQEGRNRLVRNLENGWIYARENVVVPALISQACIKSCEVLGLDFGAVDCAAAEDGSFVIFEVNTAPGLEGTTLVKYADAINKLLAEKQKQKQNAQVYRRRGFYR